MIILVDGNKITTGAKYNDFFKLLYQIWIITQLNIDEEYIKVAVKINEKNLLLYYFLCIFIFYEDSIQFFLNRRGLHDWLDVSMGAAIVLANYLNKEDLSFLIERLTLNYGASFKQLEYAIFSSQKFLRWKIAGRRTLN